MPEREQVRSDRREFLKRTGEVGLGGVLYLAARHFGFFRGGHTDNAQSQKIKPESVASSSTEHAITTEDLIAFQDKINTFLVDSPNLNGLKAILKRNNPREIVGNFQIEKKSTVDNGVQNYTVIGYNPVDPESPIKRLLVGIKEPAGSDPTTHVDIRLEVGLSASYPDEQRKALISRWFNESPGLANAKWTDEATLSSRESQDPDAGDITGEVILDDGSFHFFFYSPSPNPDFTRPTISA